MFKVSQLFIYVAFQFECCGIDSVEDYLENGFHAQYCCADENNECTLEIANTTELIYLEGCANAVITEVKRIGMEAGYYSTIISLLQVIHFNVYYTQFLCCITPYFPFR